jgi:hypothetical protein
VPEVTDTVSTHPDAARCVGVGALGLLARGERVHVFSIKDSLRSRWPQAVCSQPVPLAAVGPSVGATRGCERCVLGVIASGTALRHHRAGRSGVWAGLIARVHSRTHAVQFPRYPVIRLPFAPVGAVERDGRVSDTLVPPCLGHRRVAR